MLRNNIKMDNNKHDHEEPSSRSTALWTILGVIVLTVALVIIYMGYNLVVSSRELSEFQGFTVAVLGALLAGISGIYIKISIDKGKSETARMKHEEALETIRLQTNGRLHKRDDQLADYRDLVSILFKENSDLKRSNVSTSEILLVESEDVIKKLVLEIEKRDKELRKLRPFYPKD